MENKSLISKIKAFFSKIFQKNDTKLLDSESTKNVDQEEFDNEKDRIFALYNQAKLGQIDLMELPESDIDKILAISNEEIKVLESKYNNCINGMKA